MKKILSFILILTMLLCMAYAVNAEGGKFTDVAADSWYYEDVYNAVRLGIINGKSDTVFAPGDNLTYAEAIKLAACMYQLYTDGSVYLVPMDTPWYKTYVDYSKKHLIITDNFFENVTNIEEKATRAGYMEIFSNALPDEALESINNVPDGSIPDVPMVHESSVSIYRLYRAGILQGVDEAHNCNPSSTITRCEVASIITRMMNERKRIKFSMGTASEEPKAEEPKNEEPEKEAPKLEIPEKIEFIPPKEKPGQVPETPDMFEPLEIVIQPRQIDVADEGEELEYTVTASGGKTPYTYQWSARSWHNQWSALENGEYIKGAKTKTLSVTFSIDNPLTSQFRCRVTDALGQEVNSDYVTLPEQTFIFKPEDAVKFSSGYIFTGRVEKGVLRPGDTVSMHMPDKNVEVYGVVSKIEMFKKSIDEVKTNDYCGILIDNPQEIPYDSWIIQSLGEDLAEKVEAMGNFGFKVVLHGTFQISSIKELGETATIRMYTRGGTPPYSYEWYMSENGGEYKKITNNDKYTVKDHEVDIVADTAEFDNDIWYRCEVTDAAGNTTSQSCYGIVPKATPYLTRQPRDAYANPGDEVSFNVRSRGDGLTYQWYVKYDGRKTWQTIDSADSWASGETTNTLTVQVEKNDLAIHCEYRCQVTNGSYEMYSDSAKLLAKNLIITEQPENQAGQHGRKVRFTVTAEGINQPITYQWLLKTPENDDYLQITEGFTWAGGQNTDALTVYVDATKLTSDYKFCCAVTDSTGAVKISDEACVIVSGEANVDLVEDYDSTPDMIVIMK